MSKYTARVVEDNRNKRVIVLKDSKGHQGYKSIYVKKKQYLKIVDFSNGLLFDGVIGKEAQKGVEKKHHESTSTKHNVSSNSYEEQAKIASKINVKDLKMNVVEDNRNKRIMLFKDNNGHVQYKSIYVKRAGKLKIIDLNDGLVYHGNI